jgi:hypothetical protein
MSDRLADQIEELLRAEQFDPATFNAVEREGDTAFELVRARIETAAGIERARALRLLLMLCRQFSSHRLPEAMHVALS